MSYQNESHGRPRPMTTCCWVESASNLNRRSYSHPGKHHPSSMMVIMADHLLQVLLFQKLNQSFCKVFLGPISLLGLQGLKTSISDFFVSYHFDNRAPPVNSHQPTLGKSHTADACTNTMQRWTNRLMNSAVDQPLTTMQHLCFIYALMAGLLPKHLLFGCAGALL